MFPVRLIAVELVFTLNFFHDDLKTNLRSNIDTGHRDASSTPRSLLGDDVRPGVGQTDDDGPRPDDPLDHGHRLLSRPLRPLHERLLVLGPREEVSAVRGL